MKTILGVLSFLQNVVKNKFGIFILGLGLGIVIGAIPSTVAAYVFYKSAERNDQLLVSQVEKTQKAEDNEDYWQERAFDNGNTCVEKFFEMTTIFQEMESFYAEKEKESRIEIDKKRNKLKSNYDD